MKTVKALLQRYKALLYRCTLSLFLDLAYLSLYVLDTKESSFESSFRKVGRFYEELIAFRFRYEDRG